MRRWGIIVSVALLAGVSGALVTRRPERSMVVRTISLGGTLMAVDGHSGNVWLAGGNHLRLLDGRTGAVLRMLTLQGSVSPVGEIIPPSVLALDERNRRLLVTTYDSSNGVVTASHVNVVDIQGQRLISAITIPTLPLAMAVDEAAGRAFIATVRNNTFAASGGTTGVIVLDSRSGAILGHILPGQAATGIVADGQTGHTFVASQRTDRNGFPIGTDRVSLVDARSGRVMHTAEVPRHVSQMVVDAQHRRVVVLSRSNRPPYLGSVSTLDARTGIVLNSVSLPMSAWGIGLDERAARAFAIASPYSPPFNGGLSVLDVRDGTLLRTIGLKDEPFSITTVDATHGRVFVIGEQTDANSNPTGPGSVRMLDARSGALLRTITVGRDPSAVAVDARGGRLVVASVGRVDPMQQGVPLERGSVSILDARTGRLSRSVSVGVAPRAIVADELTGRAFVLCDGGTITTQPPDPWAWLPRSLRGRLAFLPPPPSPRTRVVPPSLIVLDATR